MNKKIILVCILCLSALMVFTACTSDSGTPSASAPASASAAASEAASAAASESASAKPAVSQEASPSATSVDVSGTWTDPVTGDILEMDGGKFSITDPDGKALDDGTYKAGTEESTYDVTYKDGTTGSFTVTAKGIEFDDSEGNTVVFGSKIVQ